MDKQKEMIAAAERAGLEFDSNGVHEQQYSTNERIQLYFTPGGGFVWNIMVECDILDMRFWDVTHYNAIRTISDAILLCMLPNTAADISNCKKDDFVSEIDRLDARVVELEEQVVLYGDMNRKQAEMIVRMGGTDATKEIVRLNQIIKDIQTCVSGV